MKKKALVTGLSLCLMLGQASAATVADDMDGFFNDVGFASNTTNFMVVAHCMPEPRYETTDWLRLIYRRLVRDAQALIYSPAA